MGLWALVVDAAPQDVRAMFEGLLATMIQGKDTELEEATYDEDFLLVRVVMTGWKYHEEGVRDVDVLVAAAVEAIDRRRRDGPGYAYGLDSNDTKRSSIRWTSRAHRAPL